MTTEVLPRDDAAPLRSGRHADEHSVDARGRTHIEARVVERIAAAAVNAVDEVVGGPRQLLGLRMGQQEGVRVEAAVHGSRVEVAVRAVLVYPSPVREVVADLRRCVVQRVEELTGMRVIAVDFVVTGLAPDAPAKVR